MARVAYASVSEIVEERAELTTFNNLLRRSKVISRVDQAGPWTILAPTNDAFDRLPEGAIGGLVHDSDKLRRVIEYHVIAGEYPTAGVIEPDTWPTLLDEAMSVMPADNALVVGSAQVIEPDLIADNGLVHVIDTVLLPD